MRTKSMRSALYVCATPCELIVGVISNLDFNSTMPCNESAHRGGDACPVRNGNEKMWRRGLLMMNPGGIGWILSNPGTTWDFMVEKGVG